MDNSKTNLWIDKYRPIKSSQLIGNKQAIYKIREWLQNFDEYKQDAIKKLTDKNTTRRGKQDKDSPKSCMIITGNHGVGKTISLTVILKEQDYEIHYLNFNDVKNSKNVKDVIQSILKTTDIIDMIHKKQAKNIAIVVDEIESITSTTEKNNILAFQKDNDINWHFPVIFISNNQHHKLLPGLRKTCYEVKFYPPYPGEMNQLLARIVINEKINLKDKEPIDIIIKHAQSDLRRLVYILQDLQYIYKNKEITVEMAQKYCQYSKKKDLDISLFDATKKLFYEYEGIDACLILFETEKVLLPLMVHENYHKNVFNKKTKLKLTDEETMDTLKHVSDYLSQGDVIENFIYGDQNWNMQEVHGFYTCAATSYYLNQHKMDAPSYELFNFTTDLNKTSIRNINKKNISNTEKCFKNKSIFDYIYINKILRQLIADNKIKECVKILKGYNIKLEHIESLLKIDKIKTTKNSLTSKQKKEFQTYLDLAKKNDN